MLLIDSKQPDMPRSRPDKRILPISADSEMLSFGTETGLTVEIPGSVIEERRGPHNAFLTGL